MIAPAATMRVGIEQLLCDSCPCWISIIPAVTVLLFYFVLIAAAVVGGAISAIHWVLLRRLRASRARRLAAGRTA